MSDYRDRDYYSLLKEIEEVKDLLGEVLRRLGNLEYSGKVEMSDGQSPFGGKSISVDVSLHKKNRWDRLNDTKKKKK